MVAALELHLDVRATRRIRVLWDLLEDLGVKTLRSLQDGRHRPHVSLIAARSLDPDAVEAAVRGLTVAAPLRLNFHENAG